MATRTKKKPAVKRARVKKAAEPESPAPPSKILVLRSCRADGSSQKGWKYPLTEGAIIEAPDWNAKAECGGGFHGLPFGQGDFSLMCWDDDAWFQVFECDAADVVQIDASKVKFRRGKQVFIKQALAPGFALAMAYIDANDPRPKGGEKHSDADSGSASASGDSGSASASGASGRASASGYYGRASASGYYGSASASGDSGSASASGPRSIAAMIGYGGRAMAGPDGALVVAWWDGKRPRLAVGYVGEDDIESGAWYEVKNGKLARCTS